MDWLSYVSQINWLPALAGAFALVAGLVLRAGVQVGQEAVHDHH